MSDRYIEELGGSGRSRVGAVCAIVVVVVLIGAMVLLLVRAARAAPPAVVIGAVPSAGASCNAPSGGYPAAAAPSNGDEPEDPAGDPDNGGDSLAIRDWNSPAAHAMVASNKTSSNSPEAIARQLQQRVRIGPKLAIVETPVRANDFEFLNGTGTTTSRQFLARQQSRGQTIMV